MEDLFFNGRTEFTKWVVADGLLREPFVVVDVGVQGGVSPRWSVLRDYLLFHGFDPIAEVIDDLKQRNAGRTNRHFHAMAIGDEDGEREFYVNLADPTSSSILHRRGDNRFDDNVAEQARAVPIRRLDSLLAAGIIPTCDFLKVDVEGFEKPVFAGARKLLEAGVLGVETETNFGVSSLYPKSHIAAVLEVVTDYHLLLFDIGFDRRPRASFRRRLARGNFEIEADDSVWGRPATFNALFCRDLIEEADHADHYPTPCRPAGVDQMIKTMIICELYGLNDVALDMAERFAALLGPRFDVDQAVSLLADPFCRDATVVLKLRRLTERVRALEGSRSWRMTAPLRAVRRLFGDSSELD